MVKIVLLPSIGKKLQQQCYVGSSGGLINDLEGNVEEFVFSVKM